MPDAPEWLLLGHAASTWALAGLIWLVQLVHYPLFARVGNDQFEAYQRDHVRRIGWVAAPLMLVEAATGLALAWWRPTGVPMPLIWTGAALLAAIWVSTFLWQVPQHNRLNLGFDEDAHAKLVRGNWLRTAAWTLRAGSVTAMLACTMAA